MTAEKMSLVNGKIKLDEETKEAMKLGYMAMAEISLNISNEGTFAEEEAAVILDNYYAN